MESRKYPFNAIQSLYRTFRSSLRYKLAVYFIAISIIPLIVVSYIVYLKTTGLMLERDTARIVSLNSYKMAGLDRVFGEIESIMSDLTTNINTTYLLKNLDDTNYESDRSFNVISEVGANLDSFMTVKRSLFDSVAILPKKGGIPIFRGTFRTEYTNDFTQLLIYKQTAANNSKTQWLFDYNSDTGRRELTVSKAVVDVFSDKVLGIALFYVDVDSLLEDIKYGALLPGESTFIVNEKRMFVFNSDRTQVGSLMEGEGQLKPIWDQMSGSFTTDTTEGKAVVVYKTSSINGWKMVQTTPYSQIVEGVSSISRVIILVTLIVGVFAFLLAMLVYLNIYRPISVLMRTMKRVELGQLEERIELRRTDELGGLSRAFNYLAERMQTLIHDVKEEQKQKKEQAIRALQAQITPHFLYNTINAMKSLARLGRNNEIEDMAGSLIDLLRISASHHSDIISIQDELNYVNSYIKIMEYRYKLSIEIISSVEERLLSKGILKFSLQPIVENCIIHAFTPAHPNPMIQIIIHSEGEDVLIAVIDNGVGIQPEVMEVGRGRVLPKARRRRGKQFTSIGIDNIQERMTLHFGERYGLEYKSEPGEGTSVQLRMPTLEVEQSG